MRLLVRAAMTLVALAAAALSYQSLTHLGLLCGYSTLAWLYPLVVDLGAAASCAAWLHTRGLQPLLMTWSLLATSVVLNGTDHFLESTALNVPWWLTVGVAAVPPAVLGCVVHLAVGLGRAQQAEPVSSDDIECDTGDVPAVEPPPEPRALRAVAEPLTLLDQARQVVAASTQPVGRNRLARELSISTHQARILLAELDKAASA